MAHLREVIYETLEDVEDKYLRNALIVKIFLKEMNDLESQEGEIRALKIRLTTLIRRNLSQERLICEIMERCNAIITKIKEKRNECMNEYEKETLNSDSDSNSD